MCIRMKNLFQYGEYNFNKILIKSTPSPITRPVRTIAVKNPPKSGCGGLDLCSADYFNFTRRSIKSPKRAYWLSKVFIDSSF